MKLAASNIAWEVADDETAYAMLRAYRIDGLEIAPTRIWPGWSGISPEALKHFHQSVEDAGLTICSLQALLFGKPELQLFGTNAEQSALRDHLVWCADIARALGASRLVFGAPANRRRHQLSAETAFERAVTFFQLVAQEYARREVVLVFEANPVEYGCDFATDVRTAAALVRAVASPAFRLHIDAACAYLAGDDVAEAIAGAADLLQHFHVSEPYLAGFDIPSASHTEAAGALDRISYVGWAALEMKRTDRPLVALETALRYMARTYRHDS